MGFAAGALFKIALPGLLRMAGLGKWLRERGIHLPSEHVQDACDNANRLLVAQGQMGTVTPSVWRAVEATQAQILGDGITTRVTPR